MKHQIPGHWYRISKAMTCSHFATSKILLGAHSSHPLWNSNNCKNLSVFHPLPRNGIMTMHQYIRTISCSSVLAADHHKFNISQTTVDHRYISSLQYQQCLYSCPTCLVKCQSIVLQIGSSTVPVHCTLYNVVHPVEYTDWYCTNQRVVIWKWLLWLAGKITWRGNPILAIK